MPSLIADKTTGLHLCIAVLGALYHRKCTGEGQMIEVPMLETLASFWLTEHLFGATWSPERAPMGYDRIINKFRHPFPTKDGYICALPYTDAHWIRFFELAERPDLAKEKRFVDRMERAKHFSELYQVLAELLKHRPTQEWLDMFDEADIPAMPVRTLEELKDDPHLKATGFFTEREHPTEGPDRLREDQGRVPPPRPASRQRRRRGPARGRPQRRGDREAQGGEGTDRTLEAVRTHSFRLQSISVGPSFAGPRTGRLRRRR
jgi:crotonobetainyl-CoA:carnitine CoA-transferase CaiB-like acyl-CoA transferase